MFDGSVVKYAPRVCSFFLPVTDSHCSDRPAGNLLDGETASEIMKIKRLKLPKDRQLLLLRQRISVLEDALHLTSEAGEAHPLLSPELLRIKQDLGCGVKVEDAEALGTERADVGTLLRSGSDLMRYFGASATEVCACSLLCSRQRC